jgi:hypothetical protein
MADTKGVLGARCVRRGALRTSIHIDGIFEHDPLIVTSAFALGLYTILAGRPLLPTLDATFSTCYNKRIELVEAHPTGTSYVGRV